MGGDCFLSLRWLPAAMPLPWLLLMWCPNPSSSSLHLFHVLSASVPPLPRLALRFPPPLLPPSSLQHSFAPSPPLFLPLFLALLLHFGILALFIATHLSLTAQAWRPASMFGRLQTWCSVCLCSLLIWQECVCSQFSLWPRILGFHTCAFRSCVVLRRAGTLVCLRSGTAE